MPIIDVNPNTSTGALSVYDDANTVVTTYTCVANTITLAPLTTLTISRAQLALNLTDIDTWIALLLERVSPVLGNLSNYDIRLNRNTGNLRFRFDVLDAPLSDARCTYATQLVAIEPRPETTMSVRLFRRWIASWRLFEALAQTSGG